MNHDKGNMPSFGKDIVIRNACNINDHSYSNLGYAYKHDEYAFGIQIARSYLEVMETFKVEEI